MKTLGKLIALLLVIGFIGLFGWLIFIGAKNIIIQFGQFDTKLGSLIILVSAVILISALIIGWAIRSIAYSGDRAIQPEKAIIYSKFLEMWIQNKNKEITSDEFQNNYLEIKKHMILWSSDSVLQQFIQFDNQLNKSIEPAKINVFAEKVILEIRKDLGVKNRGINLGNIANLLKLPSN
jgi:hypothetical protein